MTTRCSGDNEYPGKVTQGLSTDKCTADNVTCRAFMAGALHETVQAILEDENITHASAFIAIHDSANQVRIKHVELHPGGDNHKSTATATTAEYQLADKHAIGLYHDFCNHIEVLFNSEDQTPNSSMFCLGDINNNYFVG